MKQNVIEVNEMNDFENIWDFEPCLLFWCPDLFQHIDTLKNKWSIMLVSAAVKDTRVFFVFAFVHLKGNF